MKRVWKKPRRLHGVCDERSGKAVDGDGGRYRRACVPGTGGRAPFNGPGLAGSLAGYRRSYGSGFSAENGIEIDFIRISGLRGKGIKAQLLAPVRIFNAWRQARAIMKRFQPDVVLGMGGYVSGPGGLAAWSLGIPVVLHEQNGIAGLTNKWLAKIAKKVMQAFPGAFRMRTSLGTRCAPMYWRCRCQVSVWLAVRDRFACWWSVALRVRAS